MHYYDVELRDNYNEQEGFEGTCRRSLLKIVLDNSVARSIKEEDFVHEMLHALLLEIGFDYDKNKKLELTEEELVLRIAPMLYQVLEENYIMKAKDDKNKS